jgi:hypothetical protein
MIAAPGKRRYFAKARTHAFRVNARALRQPPPLTYDIHYLVARRMTIRGSERGAGS